MRRVPRVARRRKRQAEIRATDREFVGFLLAEQDRAGVAQPHPAFRILIRHMVQVPPRARRRADAARLVDVLETNRNAVQRAARTARRDVAGRSARCIVQDENIAVQLAVENTPDFDYWIDDVSFYQ